MQCIDKLTPSLSKYCVNSASHFIVIIYGASQIVWRSVCNVAGQCHVIPTDAHVQHCRHSGGFTLTFKTEFHTLFGRGHTIGLGILFEVQAV